MKVTINLNRILRVALPVLVVGSVGYAGVTLLHESHAEQLEPTAPTITPGTSPLGILPLTANSSCCQVSVKAARHNTADVQRISLDVSIVNLTDVTVQLSPGLQTFLSDTSGTMYPYTARYLPAGATIGGPLAAKAIINLTLDFDLPANVVPRLLSFQEDASTQPILLGLPAWTP